MSGGNYLKIQFLYFIPSDFVNSNGFLIKRRGRKGFRKGTQSQNLPKKHFFSLCDLSENRCVLRVETSCLPSLNRKGIEEQEFDAGRVSFLIPLTHQSAETVLVYFTR